MAYPCFWQMPATARSVPLRKRGRFVSARRPTHRFRTRALAIVLGVAAGLLGVLLLASPVTAEGPTVHAVLFYSPTCPHCHQVISEDLPPLQAKFGDKLEVLLVDVTAPVGADLYGAAIAQFNVPEDRIGVPTMVVGDTVLVGSVEIPEQFPLNVERLLTSGGADWPPIAGLASLLPASGEADPEPTGPPPEVVASATTAATAASVVDLVARDPIGNTLAIIVLIGLLGSLAWASFAILRAHVLVIPGPLSRWIPLVALAGLSVAGYLSLIEVTNSSAVCGPVGNCNLVHTSVYARVLGIPVGLLGVTGYAAILALLARCRPVRRGSRGRGSLRTPRRGSHRDAVLRLLDVPRAVRDRRHLCVVPRLGGPHGHDPRHGGGICVERRRSSERGWTMAKPADGGPVGTARSV